MTDVLKLTPTESLEVCSATPEALEVEATYGPAGSPPPRHFHPEQDERFEVLAGTMRVRVDGEERELEAGATIGIARGQVHQMWNPGAEPARVRWVTSPARLGGPDWLLRPALAALAVLGRARGYSAP